MPKPGIAAYIKQTISRFIDDDATTQGAALAYYTTFSLPPLLLIIVAVAGLVFGREAVQGKLDEQIQGLIGSEAAGQVQTMVSSAGRQTGAGWLGAILGVAALLFGATTAFAQLQAALNRVWHVKPDPEAGGIQSFVVKRLLSLGMVLGLAFLLLVSLAVSAALAAFGGWVGSLMPGVSQGLLWAVNFLISFGIITLLFAAIYRVLPDAVIEWREVWTGAAITALLFTAGKTLIGMYLGASGAASAYGAAGSLVIIVLWVYYSSLILLLGAEFTRVWADTHGKRTQPKPGAVLVVEEEKHIREPDRMEPAA